MTTVYLRALALVLCVAACSAAVAGEERHDKSRAVEVLLSDRQIAAGDFAIAEVGRGEIGRTMEAPGAIVPSGEHIARVAVRLLGTVIELRKRLGDRVIAGEVVAVIESREVADAKSEYLATTNLFELQQTLAARSKGLFEGKAISENEYLRTRSTFEEARIKREVARQKLFALNLTASQIDALPQEPAENLRRQQLRAPISGQIAERRVELGGLVGREGQESELYTIVDLATVWADLAVSPSQLAAVKEGQQIRVRNGGEGALATVIFVGPLLDKETRFARVVAAIDNTTLNWRPGAFVTAGLPAAPTIEADVVVPRSALQTIAGHDTVFVRTETGFAAREVMLGRGNSEFVEVTNGLAAGERIATQNSFVLKADLGKSVNEHGH